MLSKIYYSGRYIIRSGTVPFLDDLPSAFSGPHADPQLEGLRNPRQSMTLPRRGSRGSRRTLFLDNSESRILRSGTYTYVVCHINNEEQKLEQALVNPFIYGLKGTIS